MSKSTVDILAIIISVIALFLTIANFELDVKRERIHKEIRLNKIADEVFDMLGENKGTLWVEADDGYSLGMRTIEIARRKLENELLIKDKYHKRGLELKVILLFKSGKHSKAMDLINDVIERYPDYHKAYNCRGNIHRYQGNNDQAQKDYEKAILLAKDHAPPYNNLATIYHRNGEKDKALEFLDKAINKDAYFTYAYFNRSEIYRQNGKIDKAIKDLINVAKIDPKFRGINCELGTAYCENKDYSQANRYFQEALKNNPHSNNALNLMAWFLATCPSKKHRNGQRAHTFIKRVITIYPENPHLLDTLAAVYAELGLFKKAIKTQKRAISLITDDCEFKEEAKQHLRYYKKGKPWRMQHSTK